MFKIKILKSSSQSKYKPYTYFFQNKSGLYLKVSLKSPTSQPDFRLVSEPSPYFSITNLGAWLRIIQSLTFLLLEPVINWVLFLYFYKKIVAKALRNFPQFESLASKNITD